MSNDQDAARAAVSSADTLRELAGDLTEVHSLLRSLCEELGGGGIVQARHLER